HGREKLYSPDESLQMRCICRFVASDVRPESAKPAKADIDQHRSSDTTKDHLDGGSIFDPSRPSMRPRILTRNDFAPSTNSMRTVRDEVGTTRVLDGPGKRIGLS